MEKNVEKWKKIKKNMENVENLDPEFFTPKMIFWRPFKYFFNDFINRPF